MAEGATSGHGSLRGTRFALTKFRPPTLPATLITRSALHERLNNGAGRRLTVVVGSAGAGKSVLLADWAAARPPGMTSWLSCDRADADPARFWAGFIEAPRAIEAGFGADAADLLAMDRRMSADVTASVANDAAKLPAGSAVIVDDFHYVAAAAAPDMTDLVERWPAETAQLILASRFDPPLRQHRLRISGQLNEIRDRDLYFSLTEGRNLLANFSVQMSEQTRESLPRRAEVPFDSAYKFMATFHDVPGSLAGGIIRQPHFTSVKGAPDVVLQRCGYALWHGEVVPAAVVAADKLIQLSRQRRSAA